MRYLMTYEHLHADGGHGHGNVDVTAPARPTMRDVRDLEASVRKLNGPECIGVVLLNLIPLASEEA
jgi:hypothetical protein